MWVISSQARPKLCDSIAGGKVQRLSRKGVLFWGCQNGKRLAPRTGDDIVHPFWKHKERCKALVAGSSPAPGARFGNKLCISKSSSRRVLSASASRRRARRSPSLSRSPRRGITRIGACARSSRRGAVSPSRGCAYSRGIVREVKCS